MGPGDSLYFRDSDLAYIVRAVAPDAEERGGTERLIRSMKEDPELLEAMLSDERLFHGIMDDPERVLDVSGRLFFSVLLNRARNDLKKQTFTFERENRYSVVVFDTSTVLSLLEDRTLRYYLADLLSSFVRIDRTSLYVRVKPNILERIEVDDFDIESLIHYSRSVDRAQRVLSYKRIGDICLFLLGVFSDYIEMQRLLPGAWYRAKSRRELAECGTYYYREALRQRQSLHPSLEYALNRLSREFSVAVKPLVYVSSRYLGFIRRTSFIQ
ncbi:hypothetical protein [Salinispira pacifica]